MGRLPGQDKRRLIASGRFFLVTNPGRQAVRPGFCWGLSEARDSLQIHVRMTFGACGAVPGPVPALSPGAGAGREEGEHVRAGQATAERSVPGARVPGARVPGCLESSRLRL